MGRFETGSGDYYMSAKSFKRFFIGFFVWAVVFSAIGLFQAAVFSGTASAASVGVNETPGWPHEKSDLYPDPALVFGKLPNGFRYVLMENHEPKARVSMHLNVQAGSMSEADHEQGLAHFLEHMLFNGSTHFKPGELVKYFQNIGMEFGPDANAHTGFYETVYSFCLKETGKILKKVLLY
jgi:zinc protease